MVIWLDMLSLGVDIERLQPSEMETAVNEW
jgi:hypothetical protein